MINVIYFDPGDPLGHHCPVEGCESKFPASANLNFHTRFRHTKAGDAIICELCGKALKNAFSMKTHIEVEHERYRHKFQYYCPLCGTGFDEHKALKAHEKKHESLASIGGFHCTFCSANFVHSSALRKHTLAEHADTSLHRCKICNAALANIHNLRIHEKRHSSDAPRCTICNKPFPTQKILERHMVIHSENRPRFNCNQCSESYVRKSLLQRHTRTVHENKTKSYSCYFCGKTYHNKSVLRCHEQLHSGKKFPCPNCTKEFNNNAYLEQHLRGHCSGQSETERRKHRERRGKGRNYNVKVQASYNPTESGTDNSNSQHVPPQEKISDSTPETNTSTISTHNNVANTTTNTGILGQQTDMHNNAPLENNEPTLSYPLTLGLHLSMNSSGYFQM